MKKSFDIEKTIYSNKQKSLRGNIPNSTMCSLKISSLQKKQALEYKMGPFKRAEKCGTAAHAHMCPVSKYTCTCRPSPPPPPPLRVHFKDRQRCQGNKQADREHAGKSLALNFRSKLASHPASLSLHASVAFLPARPVLKPAWRTLATAPLHSLIKLHADPPRFDTHWRPVVFQRCWILLICPCSHTNERRPWANHRRWEVWNPTARAATMKRASRP